MASSYPGALDVLPTNSTNSTESEDTHPALHNDANDAINKIQAELGANPSGSKLTVLDRLDAGADEELQILNAFYGVKALTFDRRCVPNPVASFASGTIRASAVVLHKGDVVSKLAFLPITAGVGITASGLALYDKGFTKLAETGSMNAAFQSTGWQSANLGSPYTVFATDVFYLAIFQTYTTSAALYATDNSSGSATNTGEPIVAGGGRSRAKMTGQSSFPSVLTPSESGHSPLIAAI